MTLLWTVFNLIDYTTTLINLTAILFLSE